MCGPQGSIGEDYALYLGSFEFGAEEEKVYGARDKDPAGEGDVVEGVVLGPVHRLSICK